MIKEEERITKYTRKKNKTQLVLEYLRTAGVAFIAALIFTGALAIHARKEMIKNLYANTEVQQEFDENIAREIILQQDFSTDLKKEKYSVCMHVGELYETIHDFSNAQIAYEYAVKRAKPDMYKPYYKLATVLIAQGKFNYAQNVINLMKDTNDRASLRYKIRAYTKMGDRYYSKSDFLKSAESYERAYFYYNKSGSKDDVLKKSITTKIAGAYTKAADVMVKDGMNSDAVSYLKKAEKRNPDNMHVKYKLAIILSDSDPEKSIKYFEELFKKVPQYIDSDIYCNALMKAAQIAELDNRPTRAKYYRYKIHSVDLFTARKVIYPQDINIKIEELTVKKAWLAYPVKAVFKFVNVSSFDIPNLRGDFVLTKGNKEIETISRTISNKNSPLISNGYESLPVNVTFKEKIYTPADLSRYTIRVYLYKDKKYKTLVSEIQVPEKSFKYGN